MAAKKKYSYALNLGLLGFSILLSLFETSRGKEHSLPKLVNHKHYNFSVGNLEETYKRFFVRDISQAEREFFLNYLNANPNVSSEMVYMSFALSNEYQFY